MHKETKLKVNVIALIYCLTYEGTTKIVALLRKILIVIVDIEHSGEKS